MVEVEEGRELRFRGDLYSQESTFPLVDIRDSLPVGLAVVLSPSMAVFKRNLA